MAVAAEFPAHADRGIQAVGAERVQVRRSKVLRIAAQVVHRVSYDAELKIPRKLDAHAHQTFQGNRLHRSGVLDLRDIVPEGELRVKEKKQAPGHGAAEWL